MKRKKAPGVDNITIEEMDAATQGNGLTAIHRLCNSIWENEELPSQWKQAVIVPLHKKKDKMVCSNYRGISLLCHSSKIFSSIVLRRIKDRTEMILSEAQAGFRRNRSTIDQIFTLRQLAEKYEEFGKDLFVCYVDFRKAFDSIWRRGLWKVMRHFGYPEKIIRILEHAYKDTFSAVRVDGEITDWFATIVGVMQGCVLSPLLFNIFLEMVMALALESSEYGAIINGVVIGNLRFADDIAVLAEKESDLQDSVSRIAEVSLKMGMKINAEKTEIQHLGKGDRNFHIHVDGQPLSQTGNVVYLGGTISSKDGPEYDVSRRIGLARGIFQNLSPVWTSKEISKPTKLRVYETLVLTVLLYNSETWMLREAQKHRLRVMEMAFLRKIEGITRRDRIRNEEIYSRLSYQMNVEQRIEQRRFRYFGHVSRMDYHRYPRIAMDGYVHGQRSRGRPKKRWLDGIRQDCEERGLSLHDAMNMTQDRKRWKTFIEELPMRATASPRQ